MNLARDTYLGWTPFTKPLTRVLPIQLDAIATECTPEKIFSD
ncbi:hypothetical protein [Streptomyces sp. NPDC002769]